jgi:hypothetical protein
MSRFEETLKNFGQGRLFTTLLILWWMFISCLEIHLSTVPSSIVKDVVNNSIIEGNVHNIT